MIAPARSSGSILVIIMVTLVFAVTALVAYMDKASNDLLVASHIATADRLRMDAYSALEVTLATLEDFSEAEGGLHSPGEGWGDPIGWSGWDPGDGNQVAVSFQDESGKIPLIHASPAYLTNMFLYWQLPQDTSEHLADVLAGWMEKNHITTTALPDYDQATIPYAPPLRSMRSFSELAAIDFVKDTFFDKDGRPNQLWWRFYSDFSIFSFKQPNINGANADVLGGLGQFADTQQQAISDYLNGKGNYTTPSPLGKQWFSDGSQLAGVVGGVGDPQAFGTAITALRILITVTQGTARFDLSVVVAPSKGGASIVTTNATNIQQGTATSGSAQAAGSNGLSSTSSQNTATATAAQTAAATAANLQYPFTILEILENDAILTPPPPPPPS